MLSTGEGNSNPLWLDSMKRQKDTMLEDETPRSEGIQYTTGEEWRAITSDGHILIPSPTQWA